MYLFVIEVDHLSEKFNQRSASNDRRDSGVRWKCDLQMRNVNVTQERWNYADVEEHRLGCSSQVKTIIDHTLSLGNRIVRAEKELNPVRFDEFCRRLKLVRRSAMFRKLKAIGDHPHLYKYARYLPIDLDTLVDCTKLQDRDLKALVVTGCLHPFLTSSDLKREVQILSERKAKAASKRQ